MSPKIKLAAKAMIKIIPAAIAAPSHGSLEVPGWQGCEVITCMPSTIPARLPIKKIITKIITPEMKGFSSANLFIISN